MIQMDEDTVAEGMRRAMERKDVECNKAGRGMRMLRIRVPSPFKIINVDGYYLGMDMGGSNFRISVIHAFKNVKETKCEIKDTMRWKIPETAKNETIFKWTAQRMREALKVFTNTNNLVKIGDCLLVGFTFSFPVQQSALNEGILLQWNKSFNAPSLVGKDIASVLQEECAVLGLKIKIETIVNDAISTLLTGMFLHGNKCRLAIILGSGTNASLVHSSGDLVNSEWAAYGEHTEDVLPREDYDRRFDLECETGRQYFEKMTSGLYLPKLYYLLTGKCIASAKELSKLEASGDVTARMLSDRSVRLVASAIRGALGYICIKEKPVIVVDGSLYEKYFEYKERLQVALPDVEFVLGKDYSSMGSIIPLL